MRLQAVGALGELDRADDLLALARDEGVDELVRAWATFGLCHLPSPTPEVLSGLRTLADDPQTPEPVRGAARESLRRLEEK